MAKFIEVTWRLDGKKMLINTNKIISVSDQSDGSAFIECLESSGKHSRGYGVTEGYEKIKCMLIDIFEAVTI